MKSGVLPPDRCIWLFEGVSQLQQDVILTLTTLKLSTFLP
ncbi:MAG: hypothetical protein RLZZ206_1451 [Cyanobacteriota bacterium]|jgi:hypothetical protein